jgi:hypothetical protein
MVKLAALAGSAAIAFSVAGTAQVGAAPSSGVRGVVMRGPIHPVCRVEEPCTAAAKRVVLHFVGRYSSGWTKTDLRGRYSIALTPGAYTVKIPSAKFGYRPRAVTVRANRVAVLNVTIDTGIR